VVHFDTDLNRLPHAWVRGVNAFLPPSIGVRWAKVLEGDPAEENFFHARFSARRAPITTCCTTTRCVPRC
jgi:tRNA pseudouridine38-40 synthase